MKAWWAQTRNELRLSLRQGEQMLVAIAIPVLLLWWSTRVMDGPIDTQAPAVLALAVMSSSMVSLGIGTGFERHYGVLKRLGATPLGRPRLLAAKVGAVLALQVLQVGVLTAAARALGFVPDFDTGAFLLAMVAGTAAFAGIGLTLAGALSGPANLAACNGLYVVLVLVGGFAVPIDRLPSGLAGVARRLPSGALSEVLAFGYGPAAPPHSATWVILIGWAVAMPLLAGSLFRWDP